MLNRACLSLFRTYQIISGRGLRVIPLEGDGINIEKNSNPEQRSCLKSQIEALNEIAKDSKVKNFLKLAQVDQIEIELLSYIRPLLGDSYGFTIYGRQILTINPAFNEKENKCKVVTLKDIKDQIPSMEAQINERVNNSTSPLDASFRELRSLFSGSTRSLANKENRCVQVNDDAGVTKERKGNSTSSKRDGSGGVRQ